MPDGQLLKGHNAAAQHLRFAAGSHPSRFRVAPGCDAAPSVFQRNLVGSFEKSSKDNNGACLWPANCGVSTGLGPANLLGNTHSIDNGGSGRGYRTRPGRRVLIIRKHPK
jgi:hypothetical protein